LKGDPLQTFSPGDPLGSIRADTANAWTEAAKLARRSNRTGAALRGYKGKPGYLEVVVQNDTGGDLSERDVVQVSYPVLYPTTYVDDLQQEPAFVGITPTSASGTPAVLVEPIPNGSTGRAAIMGVAFVDVDITDAAHTSAKIKVGTTGNLESAAAGAGTATILWRETGTGVKLCAVLLCCADGDPAIGINPDWVALPDGSPVSLAGCAPCGADVALPLAYLNFTNKSGSATCLPASLALTRTTIDDAGSSADGFAGWVIQGSSQTAGSPYFGQYDYCGGTYQEAVLVWLTCGASGVVVNYVGAYGVAGVLSSGPLNGTLTTADQSCSLFTSPGSLALGTLVTTTPASGSVDVSLSWE